MRTKYEWAKSEENCVLFFATRTTTKYGNTDHDPIKHVLQPNKCQG